MDVDAILREHQMLADLEEQRNIRAEQERERLLARTLLGERKRPATPQAASTEVAPAKKVKVQPPAMAPIPMPRIILKPPKSVEPVYPCILCASESAEGLLECTAVPSNVIGKNRVDGKRFFAHELCAQYIPEVRLRSLGRHLCALLADHANIALLRRTSSSSTRRLTGSRRAASSSTASATSPRTAGTSSVLLPMCCAQTAAF